MKATIIRSAIALIAVAVAWILGARQLSSLLDYTFTPRLYSLPVSPLAYSLNALKVGSLPLDFYADIRTLDVHVTCDSADRVTLSDGGKLFPMGKCLSRDIRTGGFDFAPDPGDAVSLVVDRSMMSWPTFFEMNFMTGRSPSWTRHLYYRLSWHKASGSKLTMVWRFEQGFYPGAGWTSGMMTREGSTGLIQVDVIDAQ